MNKTSISVTEAIAAGVLIVGDGANVAPTVRIVNCEDDGASCGSIWIGAGSRIRDGVILHSGVAIGTDTIIGCNCVVRARASVGSGVVISHFVCIERDVRIGNNVRVSAHTHLTGGCMVGDHVQIGARVVTVNDNEMQWRTGAQLTAPVIGAGAKIGSGTTLLGGVRIGEGAFIGAASLVLRDIPPRMLAFGHPAYIHRTLESIGQ